MTSCSEKPNQSPSRTCWIVTDGAAGNRKQCEALAHYLDVSVEVFDIALKQPWDALAPFVTFAGRHGIVGELSGRLDGPWPDLLISAGRRAALASLVVKRLSQSTVQTVQILDPKISADNFDCVICPRHDQLDGPNVIQTAGALHQVDDELLACARTEWSQRLQSLRSPRVAVLVGASNRAYQIDLPYVQQMLETAKRLAGDQGALMVTGSRRTTADVLEYLKSEVTDSNMLLWTGDQGEANPYSGFLAWADHLVVSAESVNMLSEACGTGKPVYSSPPGPGNAKFQRFYQGLLEAGYLFELEAQPQPSSRATLRETLDVSRKIQQLLGWR